MFHDNAAFARQNENFFTLKRLPIYILLVKSDLNSRIYREPSIHTYETTTTCGNNEVEQKQ